MYPVNQLTTIEDCDALLAIADKEQKDLEWKKMSLLRLQNQYASNAFVNATELISKRAELETLDGIIASLPEGSIKLDHVKKRTTVWYRIFLLENRKTSFGDVALLEKVYEVQRVQRELEETATLISEVQTRKAEI